LQLSHELRIHPAIIAGRLRRETGNYKLLGDLVGQGEVRALFPPSPAFAEV
jgi:HTH-type transcriptional regulator/antitoxin HigA